MSRGKIILLLGVLLIAAGALFWGMVYIFKREIRQVYYTQMQQHAAKTAESIGRVLPQAFREGTHFPTLNQWAESGMNELVRAQQAVKAVMIVDLRGRVLLLRLAPDSGLTAIVPNPEAAQGFPAHELIGTIKKSRPNLEDTAFSLYRPLSRTAFGWLFVIYDTTPPQDMVWRAAFYTVGQLLLILCAMGMVGGVFAQQQRTTRRLREQRDRAEQLAYVGTLAAGLAHEIRNPLNALAMQLEMLDEDVERSSSPGAAVRIERIRNGLMGLERTVSEFLNYASPGQQKPAMVDLGEQLNAICREFLADQPHEGEAEGPAVECIAAPGLLAWCDVNALRQVLGNLMSNGWRMQESGRRRLRVEASREGEAVAIAVDDAGPGVPDDQRGRVFECFFTTRTDGTGLGLPIAQRLAEMNGGALSLAEGRSPLGGARFVLRLPAREPARER